MQKARLKIYSVRLKATTIIEALVLLFVFSVMTLSFYTAYSLGLTRIIESRNRLQAVSLASEQMEQIRNLPYEEVRAPGSIPGCDTGTETCYIDPDYTVNLNGIDFQVETTVVYKDDAEDGTLALSTDAIPTDYKSVSVTVSWSGGGSSHEASLVSRFVPPGLESGVAGSGALSINVLDYSGQPVPNVEVTLVNNNVSPAVNLQETTGSDGNILLYGVLEDDAYQISLQHGSDPGSYEQIQTLPLPPDTPYTPIDAHVSVIEGALNTATFILNKTSSMEVHAVDPYGNGIGDVDFHLTGGRRLDIGSDPPVYNHDADHVTDGSGEISLPDSESLSGGTYTVTVDESGYTFWKTDESTEYRDTLYLDYGVSDAVKNLVLVDDSVNGLFISVADSGSGDPIEGATVSVTDPLGGTLDSQTTDVYGMAYFPENESDVLSAGTYQVEVGASGYQDGSDSPTMSSGLEEVSINLDPS